MAQDDARTDAALAQLEGGTKIDLQQCYSCGGVHEGVTCLPYRKANPPFTHWYYCPANGDPMPLAIVLYGGNPVEINNRVLVDVARAQAGGPVLFATFTIGKRGGIDLQRHTHRFPSDRLMEAVDLLRKDLAREAPLPEPDGPLPKANLEAIFGRGNALPAAHAATEVSRNGAGQADLDSDDQEEDAEEECDE